MTKGFRFTAKYFMFWGSIFSQWHKATFKDCDGTEFSSAEQFMFYHKARLFNDTESLKAIMATTDPKKQKALGRGVKGFTEELWIEHREKIVFLGSFYKFSQNKELRNDLLFFGDRTFVEASPVDKIWGVGLHYNDVRAEDPTQWNGLNLLGKQLNLAAKEIVTDSFALVHSYEDTLYAFKITTEAEDYVKNLFEGIELTEDNRTLGYFKSKVLKEKGPAFVKANDKAIDLAIKAELYKA